MARRVRTPSAGPGYDALQALPLGGRVTVLRPSSGEPASVTVSADTSAVQISVSSDCYVSVAPDGAVDAADWLLRGPGYSTYGVEAGSTIAFRSVTGAVEVRVLEA